MRLSDHFETREFRSPDGAETPPTWLRAARKLCTGYLEPLRLIYGPVTIHSGFRSPGYNDHVGGAPLSKHLHRQGDFTAAADISCRRGTPAEWHRALDQMGAPGLGLYRGHVHVDNRPMRARWVG